MKINFTLIFFYTCFILISSFLSAQTIDNVHSSINGKKIHIYYDINALTLQCFDINVYCSLDGGITWGNPLKYVTGDVGKCVNRGTNKEIKWDVFKERSNLVGDKIVFQVRAKSSSNVEMPIKTTDEKSVKEKTGSGNIIKGKIRDSRDSSFTLPGVNIIIQGTTQGTISDVNGEYKLTTFEKEGTVVYSFVGYETQYRSFSGSQTFDLELKERVITSVSIGYRGGIKYTPLGLGLDMSVRRSSASFLLASDLNKNLHFKVSYFNNFYYWAITPGLMVSHFDFMSGNTSVVYENYMVLLKGRIPKTHFVITSGLGFGKSGNYIPDLEDKNIPNKFSFFLGMQYSRVVNIKADYTLISKNQQFDFNIRYRFGRIFYFLKNIDVGTGISIINNNYVDYSLFLTYNF